MKKTFLTLILTCGLSLAFSQKYAYISSEYILSKMPEYTEAQAELDRISVQWQKEIELRFASIDSMYKKYQVESITMPEQMKQKREQAIIDAERSAKDLQKKRFGQNGDLFKKRDELIKPIQDRVINAIDDYAREKGFAFVFDTSGDRTIIYADPKWDINEQVMKKLGIYVSEEEEETEK